ncbi:MAG TPA: hypothetical protein VHR66_00660, partial [Gemmataceae bacterium]|nr:hypothetical protein [Gemmataceae bacterium]
VRLWHQVHFGHGELVQVEIQQVHADRFDLRPAWTNFFDFPRTAIERVTGEPGWQPVVFDAFADGLAQWERSGEPRANGGRLLFNGDGQAIAKEFKLPLDAGRVSVNWQSAKTKTRRVHLILDFQGEVIRVELIGPDDRFVVATALKPDQAGKVRRELRQYALAAEFSRDGLTICIDDLVLWARAAGVKGLRSIRLESSGDGDEKAILNSVQVARPNANSASKPWADLTSDAVRAPEGDETFGSVRSANTAGIVFRVKDKEIPFAWPDVAEFAFRRDKVVEVKTVGEHVRLRVRSANGVRDVIEGAVAAYDGKLLRLEHSLLGLVHIPREQVEEIRFDFHGQRVPVDSMPRHLGSRPAFGFAVVKPEALRFAKSINVNAAAKETHVVVDAAQVDKNGAPAEVLVNGEVIGTLNRLADRGDQTVRSYRLSVPANLWRSGVNDLEVRVRPPEGATVNGIDLRAIRLELVVGR